MITLTDMYEAINGLLDRAFPKCRVYAGEVTEGFERPSFFTQILPLGVDYDTKNYKTDRLLVVITYFNENGTELENIEMHDGLADAFRMTLAVNRRHFLLTNTRSERADGALQFSFNLNFKSQLNHAEEYELMKELELKTDKE